MRVRSGHLPVRADGHRIRCYCETVTGTKNITVSVPEDVYRAARVRAAREGSSVSAVVKDFLWHFAGQDDEFDRLLALQKEVTERITDFSASDRLSRDELYDRALR